MDMMDISSRMAMNDQSQNNISSDQDTPISQNSTDDKTTDQIIIVLLRRQNYLLEQIGIRTTVIDFNMPIGSMIGFMFKWMIASIPVALIVGFVWFFVAALLFRY